MADGNVIKQFIDSVKEPEFESNKANLAVVSRVDSEGIIWVHLAGAQKETPTASTSSEVKSGDIVSVEWRNNKLYIGGNYSDPSVGFQVVRPSVDYVSELLNKDVTVNSINAATGYIEDLTADHITAGDISASSGYIKELKADNIEAEDIVADHAAVGSLDANYAKINAANITDLSAQNAWVNKLMVQTGLLAHEGTVFTLDAIQVNAANITAGTLDVNRLIVTVGEGSDAQKYLVNIDPTTGTPSYEKLDGNIVEPRTITADKIVAHDITVQEITTENLVGTNGWINLNQGKFFYGDGANFVSATNAIDWNGSKLQIKADEFLLSNGKTIQDSIEAVETWFYAVPPTTSNEPAVNWNTTNLKEQHLRDIYFDTESGKSYRWAKDGNVYSWVEIQDVQLSALAGRVSINETNIKTNSDQIALRATKTELTDAVNNIEGLNVHMGVNGTNLVFTATLIQGGNDITSTIPDGDFEWFYRTPTGDVPMNKNGRSITIPQTSQEYGRTVVCVWTRNQYAYLLNNAGNKLKLNTGNYLVGRSEY